MASRYFEIEFGDLSYEKQEDLKEEVVKSLLAEYEELGKKAMEQKWIVKPKTWQEAYCRDACVDWSDWSDLDEKSDEFQNFDWKYAIEHNIEDVAEKKLWDGFHNLEVEVEL